MITEAISPLRQRMIEDMSSRKLGTHTQRSHIHSCKRFAAFLKRSPDTATAEDIRLFQLHLAETGMSICNRNRIMTGVRFLFRVTLRRLDLAAEIYHLREPQKIAQVMSPGRDAEANTPFEKLPGTQINVPRLNLHKRPRHRRCPTSRDFVPWRFSDAGRRSAWIASSCRHPKTCTTCDIERPGRPNENAAAGGSQFNSDYRGSGGH